MSVSRSKFSSFFRLAALITLILVPICAAGQGRSTITGFVFDGERRPIDRARVELSDGMSTARARTQTDSSGRFIFNGIGTGRFEVRVVVPGSEYEEQTQSVEVGGGGGGARVETVQVEIRMRKRRTSQPTAAARVVFAQEIPDEARKHFQTAVSEIERNRPQEAIRELESAISIFPTYFSALEILGVEYMKAGMYEKARSTFKTTVSVNARSFNGWYGLSYASFATDAFAEAVAAGNKAAEVDKNAAEVFFVIGLSQRKLKKYEDSLVAFLKAKQLDKGKTPDINWNLALLYAHNLQEWGKAADELETFLAATPNNPEAENIKKLIANFRSKQTGTK